MNAQLIQRLSEALAPHVSEKEFAAGELICAEGSVGQEMYLICSGSVVVCKQIAGKIDTVIAYLNAGNCFGELALFEEFPRSATVEAAEPTQLLVVSRQDFALLMQEHPDLAAAWLYDLMKEAACRLRSSNERLAVSLRMSLQSSIMTDPEH